MVAFDGYYWVEARDVRVRDLWVCDWDDTKETREWEWQVVQGQHPEYIPVNVYEVRPVEWVLYRPPVGPELPREQYSRVEVKLAGQYHVLSRWACSRVRVVRRSH